MLTLLRRRVLYPDHYAWYVLLGALDVMLTVTLLVHLGAREVNTIAQRSIDLFGTWGLIGLKFASVLVVIAVCEYIGRRRERLGRAVARVAIAVSLFPIAAALAQVALLLVTNRLVYEQWPPPDPRLLEPSAIPMYLDPALAQE